MEDYLFGRLTTLNRLKKVRDDFSKHPFHRQQADKAMSKIKLQLKDKRLNAMRERLIKATRAGDLHEVWKIENLIKHHEHEEIDHVQ